jgi:hypothetical protein
MSLNEIINKNLSTQREQVEAILAKPKPPTPSKPS